MTISGHKSMTDWERVKREYDSDAPIPYDPEGGPYDPNDEAATEAYFNAATIWVGWPNPVMIQKDGVPVKHDKKAAAEPRKPRAKAS
ncbi:MAG: hypothetical protein ABR928_18395 [Terracidiphilus sp.]|jgi:hypothetical protein